MKKKVARANAQWIGWLHIAEVGGKRAREPSELEMAATRIVSAVRLALELGDTKGLRAADNWAREYLDDHEPDNDRRLTWAEAGGRLTRHAARVLRIGKWNQSRALEQGGVALAIVVGIRRPQRAEYIAAAMIQHAHDLRSGVRYVVKIDTRIAARQLADELVNRGLGTMQPRTLARLAARAVGTPQEDITRLFAAEKKRAQRRRRP